MQLCASNDVPKQPAGIKCEKKKNPRAILAVGSPFKIMLISPFVLEFIATAYPFCWGVHWAIHKIIEICAERAECPQ